MKGLPNSPDNVRVATEADEAKLFDLLMALYKDNNFGIPPRPMDVRQEIRAGTREKNGVLIAVIDGDEETLAGSVCITPLTWWYNKAPEMFYLNELWLFVRPEYRRHTTYFNDLFETMNAYKALMDETMGRDVPLVTGALSRKRLPAKMRLWGRYAQMVGGVFVCDGRTGPRGEQKAGGMQ